MALTKVTSNVLADEFFTRKDSDSPSADNSDYSIDFTEASVIPITNDHALTFNFTNHKPGMVKNLIITAGTSGTSSVAYHSSDTVKVLNGEYSATSGAVNFLQIICVNTNTFYVTISQEPTA